MSFVRRPRSPRSVLLASVLLAVSGGQAAWGAPATRPLVLPPAARVLVVAPHPDDETIGAGGLIYRLVHQRVPVRVVFVTNGDGYPEAVRRDFGEAQPSDADYLAFGELREREALVADRRLGLHKRDLSFLGFPDGGLAQLWRDHWLRTRPYSSPYTKEDSPPYDDTVSPTANYDGQDLIAVLMRILREFRPSVLIIPHPYDAHLDHAHASYFAIEALDELRTRHPLLRPPMLLTYLVHDATWPAAPRQPHDRLSPPSSKQIPDTLWFDLELSASELAAKEAALAEYRSQLTVLGGLLKKFCRRNELYGRIKSRVLHRIADVH